MSRESSVTTQPITQSTRRTFGIAVLASAALFSLGGCLSSIIPEPEASRLFTLPASSTALPTLSSPWRNLLVDELNPAPALNTDRLLAIGASGEVQRLGDARWIARPAELVRAGLATRLSAMGAASSVDRQALRFAADLRVLGELQAFQFDPEQRSAVLTLDLHLLCAQANRSLADRQFSASVASSAEVTTLISAYASATDQVAVEVGQWIASYQPSDCTAPTTENDNQ